MFQSQRVSANTVTHLLFPVVFPCMFLTGAWFCCFFAFVFDLDHLDYNTEITVPCQISYFLLLLFVFKWSLYIWANLKSCIICQWIFYLELASLWFIAFVFMTAMAIGCFVCSWYNSEEGRLARQDSTQHIRTCLNHTQQLPPMRLHIDTARLWVKIM